MSRWMTSGCQFVVLTKRDLFLEKIRYTPLTTCFPDYSPPASATTADELANAGRLQGVALSPSLEIDVSISAVGFVQAGLGIALVDALLPWHQFAGLAVKPLAAGPEFPIALLTSRTRPLSRADEMMRDEIRAACSAVLDEHRANA